DPVKAVEALTTAIQWAMEAEVVHVARIDATQLVRAVEGLYRDELARELAETGGVPRGRIDPIRLSRSIVDAVSHFRARDPERAADPAGLASRRRPSPLRVRRLGQLTSVLDPALDGAPDGAEGDGLRDVAISRVGRRVSDLLGDRGLAGRPGLWRGVGPGLRA